MKEPHPDLKDEAVLATDSLPAIVEHPHCALDDVHAVFRKWLGPTYDIDTIDAVMAAAAAHQLGGDPLMAAGRVRQR